VAEALETLHPQDREVLEAYFYERLTYADLAHRFRWKNKGSAHWAVRRALRRLAQTLESE
jgi:DNA-directed RNA polymerase specialized sigma24 family protein